MPYLLFLKRPQNLKLLFAANSILGGAEWVNVVFSGIKRPMFLALVYSIDNVSPTKFV